MAGMGKITEPYEARPLRFLGIWALDDWRLKAYGITYGESGSGAGVPAPVLVEAARRVAAATLPSPARTDRRYGVGFVGVHQGRGANFVFVDWWADQNELHHHVFVSSQNAPADLEEVTATGLSACVFDLAVIGAERRAWIDTALQRTGEPDVERYLARHAEGWV